MPMPYMVSPPITQGLLLPTANTFFSQDEAGLLALEQSDPSLSEPWLFLAHALLDARKGRYDLLWQLESLATQFAYEDFANACVVLLGAAAPRSLLRALAAEDAQMPPPPGLAPVHRFRALTLSQTPWAADHVLSALDSVRDLSSLREMLLRCSDIVEPGSPALDEEPVLLARERDRLRGGVDQLVALMGRDDIACLRGAPLSLADVARRMLDIASGPTTGLFAHYRLVFEAYTGWDCRHFYREHRLQKLVVAATLEDFLDSGEADRYEPGVRYFFGHRIPD